MPAKKKPVKKASKQKTAKKVTKKTSKAIAEPKVGDVTSLAFHYAGLVTWEEATIDRIAQGKEVLWSSEQLYERKSDGTYVYEDFIICSIVGPCKKVLHLDGGKRAKEYAKR